MSGPYEASTDRIPCKPSTKSRYGDFVAGLGHDATYDEALTFLLGLVKQSGENDFEAGRRLQDHYRETRDEQAEVRVA